jgi:hypothetical protein
MDPQPVPTPAESAQNEAARQTVMLVFGVLSVLLMVAAQRAAADPDFYRRARMRAAKLREKSLARLAGWSWRKAEQARVAYDRESA